MIITLHRDKDDGKRTFGRLYIDGEFYCYTLEDTHRDKKVQGETRVPRGTYRIDMRHSPKFSARYGHKMLWLKDVPNFQYILIHPGNFETNTDGCILVGKGKNDRMITQSRDAYNEIYPIIAQAVVTNKPTFITICDGDRLDG